MSGDGGAPWWASGADDLDATTDPFEAHRAARTAGDGAGGQQTGSADGAASAEGTGDERPWDVPWEDWDDRDPPRPDGAERSTVEDAVDAMGAFLRLVAGRRGGGRTGLRPHGRDQTCRACPWCVALRSLGDARPEVVDHLDEALRHLVAAARAWVDAAETRGQWQRIPLDDDESEPDRG